MFQRRDVLKFVLGGLTAPAAAADAFGQTAPAAPVPPADRFDPAQIVEMARALASKPYKAPSSDLPEALASEILHLCKRAYRALELSGYARVDLRMDDSGNVWVLEANPNPQVARGEDFAASAQKFGMSYDSMLQRIINLGLRWQPESLA